MKCASQPRSAVGLLFDRANHTTEMAIQYEWVNCQWTNAQCNVFAPCNPHANNDGYNPSCRLINHLRCLFSQPLDSVDCAFVRLALVCHARQERAMNLHRVNLFRQWMFRLTRPTHHFSRASMECLPPHIINLECVNQFSHICVYCSYQPSSGNLLFFFFLIMRSLLIERFAWLLLSRLVRLVHLFCVRFSFCSICISDRFSRAWEFFRLIRTDSKPK